MSFLVQFYVEHAEVPFKCLIVRGFLFAINHLLKTVSLPFDLHVYVDLPLAPPRRIEEEIQAHLACCLLVLALSMYLVVNVVLLVVQLAVKVYLHSVRTDIEVSKAVYFVADKLVAGLHTHYSGLVMKNVVLKDLHCPIAPVRYHYVIRKTGTAQVGLDDTHCA